LELIKKKNSTKRRQKNKMELSKFQMCAGINCFLVYLSVADIATTLVSVMRVDMQINAQQTFDKIYRAEKCILTTPNDGSITVP
jgi:hypothetical protein